MTTIVALLMLTTAFTRHSQGDSHERVLIVSSTDREVLAEGIRLELESIGFPVVVAIDDTDPRPYRDFVSVAEQEGVTALVRLRGDRPVAEIWVADAESGKVFHRDVRLERDENDETFQSQTAIEISELLRASVLELHTVAPPAEERSDGQEGEATRRESMVRRKADVNREAARPGIFKPYRLLLEAHGGITAGTFDYPPMAHLALGVHWRFLAPLGVTLLGFIPLTGIVAEREAGSAGLKQGWLGVEPRLTFANLARRFRPSAGGGVGLLIARVEGNANPGWKRNAETALATLLFLRLSAAAVLTERVSLTIDGILGRTFPSIVVNIDGDKAIGWGRIVVCAQLGIEVGAL